MVARSPSNMMAFNTLLKYMTDELLNKGRTIQACAWAERQTEKERLGVS